jgi:glycine/D-amino acid oxidase-like deaminating enzyme
VAGSRRAAAAHGLPLELLDAATLAREFPAFRCPDGHVALFEADAGFLLCERAVRTQVAQALTHGAALAVGERVISWSAASAGVEVVTSRARYQAGALVLAAGAWSAGLLGDLAVPLTVTRQVQFWIQPRNIGDFALGGSPCWALQPPAESGLFYGLPALPGHLATQLGMKLAHHSPGEITDPDAPRRPAEAREMEALLAAVGPYLDLQAPMWVGSRVCLYTLSRDGHFVLDVHPQHGRVAFACGFSGHGFKFAPVMGEALADLALEGRSALPIAFLGLR